MTAISFRRCFLPLSTGLMCLLVASCSSTKPKSGYADVVDYTTPETSLSEQEYPFDSEGNYLVDVVSGKKKGKPASGRAKVAESSPSSQSYVDTYEKPLITAVDTPSTANNPIYERVPEPEPNQPSYSTGGVSSSPTVNSSKPKTASRTSSSASRPRSTPPSSSTASRSTSKAKPKPTVKPKPKAPSSLTYKVKRGDTLFGLASRYGTTVPAIRKANGLSSNLLVDGRTLRIPR